MNIFGSVSHSLVKKHKRQENGMAYLKLVILQICELLDYVILNINLSHILVSIAMSCQMSNFEQNEPFIVQNVIWKYFVPG